MTCHSRGCHAGLRPRVAVVWWWVCQPKKRPPVGLDRGSFRAQSRGMTHPLTDIATRTRARETNYFKGSLCKGQPIELFFPEKRTKPEQYAKFCSKCPIQEFCLQFSLCFDSYGVWGGLTRSQRARIPQSVKDEAIEIGKEEGWYWILAVELEATLDELDALLDELATNTTPLGTTVFSFGPPPSL